jgi:hypothetical protein
MSGIGDLVANLTVNSAPFKKGLQSSKGLATSFASGFGKAMKVGVVGGLAAAAAGVYKVNEQLGELDKVAKLATRTGLDPKFIAAWGFAAEQSGSDSATATASLDEFTKRMGEAAAGAGPAAEQIKGLGLNLGDIMDLSPEDQILKLSEAITQLPNAAEKAAVADKLFGGMGPQLVSTMAGIKEFKTEAEGLGLGFESSELAKVEAANDAINRVKRSFGNVWSTITVQVAPAIDALFTGINDLTTSMGGFGSMADTSFSFVGDAWTWLQDTIATGITTVMAVGEWAFTNWQDLAVYAFKSVGLAGVKMGNDIAYFFTDQLPAYLTWFGDNWFQVFFTAFDFVTTAMINLGQNIRNIWTGVLEFFKGNGFEVDFNPILEGFVSTIGKLPDIPPRVMSELETNLQADVSTIGKRLGTSFDEIVTQRLDTLADMQKTAGLEKPTLAKQSAIERTATDGEKRSDVKSSGEMKFAGSMQRGSAEAFKTILSASRKSPELTESMKQTKLLQTIAKKDQKPLPIKLQKAV